MKSLKKTLSNKMEKNPYLADMKADVLYHIGLSTSAQDLKAMFGDVKVRTFYRQHPRWKLTRKFKFISWL